MKNIFLIIIVVVLFSCNKDNDAALPNPTNVSNVTVEPRIGGAMIRFTLPADSNYLYLEVSYDRNGTKRTVNVSPYTDSVLITGLLNKFEYTFTLQPVNRKGDDIVKGTVLTTQPVVPIRRPDQINYFPDQLTKITVPGSALVGYTYEPTEGAVSNLVDGNINTYWHTAWSSGVQPLPHWVKMSLDQPASLGLIKYWFRQNSGDVAGRPTQIGLETSEDGLNWTRVFTSNQGLSTDNPTQPRTLNFGQNFQSKYFRIMILATGGTTYTHLGEMEFYTMGSSVVDKEKEAESHYNDPWL